MFETTVSEHAELMQHPPVEPDAFMASVEAIDATGTRALAASDDDRIELQQFGEAMINAIGDIDDRPEIQPPLDENQRDVLIGMVAKYSLLATIGVEATQPEPAGQGATTKRKK